MAKYMAPALRVKLLKASAVELAKRNIMLNCIALVSIDIEITEGIHLGEH